MGMSKRNVERARDMRELAKLVRTLPDEFYPYGGGIQLYCSQDEARSLMARYPGQWAKERYENTVTYRKVFGRVTLSVNVTLPTCTRVLTGVRRVEAVPAHEEAVYEWRCDDV
jgi:hypothetical protein